MIKIWLIFNLLIPFIEVLVYSYMLRSDLLPKLWTQTVYSSFQIWTDNFLPKNGKEQLFWWNRFGREQLGTNTNETNANFEVTPKKMGSKCFKCFIGKADDVKIVRAPGQYFLFCFDVLPKTLSPFKFTQRKNFQDRTGKWLALPFLIWNFFWSKFLSHRWPLSLSEDCCRCVGPPLRHTGQRRPPCDSQRKPWREETGGWSPAGSPLPSPPEAPAQLPGWNRRHNAKVTIGRHLGHWHQHRLLSALSQPSPSWVGRQGEEQSPVW